MAASKQLTIFEGPDGAGKSTAAKAYAAKTGAAYVHFSALPRVNQSLGRIYVEAMLPALLGYQDVVLDRSWLSEMPYGMAFREGKDRLSVASRRMLERLALRCGAVMVRCDPGWEVVRDNFLARKGQEMLDNTDQLRAVYDLYDEQGTDLPVVELNYTLPEDRHPAIEAARLPRHPVGLASAGSWSAPTVLVGEGFAERKDQDPWYQWPFASFSNEGCSQWLASQLERADVSEQTLLWVNSDQDLSLLPDGTTVVALGGTAARALERAGRAHVTVAHPQWWKRFRYNQPYELMLHL